ncbi:hypothetical protein PTSG_10650 [Salpingoeca rosetta]|uniref:Uncharacterized protein n=1 Tax=Salpingoeca rosetta (strain ATCC 50818 / BSB-021) TaxID=946362 RepID=F2URZ1_SALR5|nr:uncharacterized protein PTSG_10650 [Salpingoeca rosetta]EGD80396.1 hypothetical protein PTSG_10650 [Salpingoeca rosetta]|eukprot:XP_004988186.1 hypothetical protein PTSG_10650 [Salpingoeca rosetta]
MPQCMAWTIKPSLAPAILDALSNLNVAPARLREICDHVLGQLGSHSPECLPIVIKFLMQQGGAVVEGSGRCCRSVTGWHLMRALQRRGCGQLKTTMAQPITALDLLVLLLLHHQNAYRRRAETTVIKLASTGLLTAAMAAAMFARHTRAFLTCFPSIVHMADILSRRQSGRRPRTATAGGGRGAGGAHWHGAGTGGGRSHACAATVAGHRPPEAAAPVCALMLDGTLDCLSNLHFIHILPFFRVLTTLTFDRQRTAAAGLVGRWCLSQSNEELKRTGTIAATTVIRTLFALANDVRIPIDGAFMCSCATISPLIYVDNNNSHQEQAHPSGCVNGDGGLTIDPPPPRPFGFRSLADPGRHDTRAREVGKDTHAVVNKKTLQAPFETKLQLPSGIAAQDRRGDKIAKARCWDADLFTFLMSLQPFVWWDLSLRTGDLNPEEELTVAEACSDDVLFRTVVDGQRVEASDPTLQQGRWAPCTLATERVTDAAALERADGTTFPRAAPWS